MYIVDAVGDRVIEYARQGVDTVRTALSSYTLGAEVEKLVYTGSASFFGIGNAWDNELRGGAGADRLDGGRGADVMVGGAGSDVYIVDNIGDVVTEEVDGGTDTIQTSLSSMTLSANVENLVFTGFGPVRGSGNALGNEMRGSRFADYLDGAGGADVMVGMQGDDVYVVDDAADRVLEVAGQGRDTVMTSLAAYTLGAEVEQLVFIGSSAFTGTGNALANVIIGGVAADTLSGGAGNDRLDGGIGADVLIGGLGDDVYIVDNVGDVVVEASGQGVDEVQTSLASYTLGAEVERLLYMGSANFTGVGNAGANTLVGGGGNDRLSGGDGADVLNGAAGDDVLSGGTGRDIFQFSAAIRNLGSASNVDMITDFNVVDDTIQLSRSIFSGVETSFGGALSSRAFAFGDARTTFQKILFDPATGALSYDADGSGAGAAVRFAVLTAPVGTLTAADFILV